VVTHCLCNCWVNIKTCVVDSFNTLCVCGSIKIEFIKFQHMRCSGSCKCWCGVSEVFDVADQSSGDGESPRNLVCGMRQENGRGLGGPWLAVEQRRRVAGRKSAKFYLFTPTPFPLSWVCSMIILLS